MKCFDCAGTGRDVDAVAVCIGCGAAVTTHTSRPGG